MLKPLAVDFSGNKVESALLRTFSANLLHQALCRCCEATLLRDTCFDPFRVFPSLLALAPPMASMIHMASVPQDR